MKISTLPVAPAPQRWTFFLMALTAFGILIASIVPPFQAPDEYDHVARAYMLSQGQIVLHSVGGSPSGGGVDSGLVDYMTYFTPMKGNPARKLSLIEANKAAAVTWSGKDTFVTAVGTAYYFPALYAPQAAGLLVGRTLGLPIGQSYMLARYAALAACLGLLLVSFRIYPPPTLALAILSLPMTSFLMSSAVLDGLATCSCLLALSAFMRLLLPADQADRRLMAILVASIALVAACRPNLLPLLLLPLVITWRTRSRFGVVCTAVATLFTLSWTVLTIKFTIYPHDARDVDHAARLISYLIHPIDFLRIVLATVSDRAIVHFYAMSFIGVLGWLDAAFSPYVYALLAGLMATVAVLSISRRNIEDERLMRSVLLICAGASIILIFLALLVQWTVGPATKIDGVQGRYFTIPVLIITYALFAHPRPLAGATEVLRSIALAILFLASVYFSTMLLVARYYTPLHQPAVDEVPSLEPSPVLGAHDPVEVHFAEQQILRPAVLGEISIRFGTYMTNHAGRATLRLWTNDGSTDEFPFALDDLKDNGYKTFELPGKRYVGGEVRSIDGVGVSTYRLRKQDGSLVECLSITPAHAKPMLTPGCPEP